MQCSLELEAKVFGNKRSVVKRTVQIENIGHEPSLGSLIAAIVRAEVQAFETRQEHRDFVHLLTQVELEEKAASGKVGAETRSGNSPEVHVEEAIETALTAFSDGLFIVLVNDKEVVDLEVPIDLVESSTVMFIRLVAIAGGF